MDEFNNIDNNNNQDTPVSPYQESATENFSDAYIFEETSNTANGLQITALVLGIISIVAACCSYWGIIFGAAAIIFAIFGNKTSTSGVGKAGMICGIVGCVLGGIMTVIGLVAISALGGMQNYLNMIQNLS